MKRASAALLALGIASCGGGDSGGGTTAPVAANTAPSFSSSGQASVAENSTDLVYRPTATDAQFDTVTFSIAGGADSAFFTLGATGELYFKRAPNYDLFADANGDNVYEVTLSASDGKLSTTKAVAITVTNEREGISVKRIATGLGVTRAIASIEDTHQLVVAGNGSLVSLINGATGATSTFHLFTDASGRSVDGMTIRGLAWGYTWGPTKRLYVLKEKGGVASIACIRCGASIYNDVVVESDIADVSDGTSIVMGQYDGEIFVGIGDQGGSRAQDSSPTGGRYGKLYDYGLDPDPFNPAPSRAVPHYFDPRLVGLGLRAPTAIAKLDQNLFGIADHGEKFSEVTTAPLRYQGMNFGWPYYDGRQERNAGGSALADLFAPSLVLPVGTNRRESKGIVGALIYRGRLTGLVDHYIVVDKSGHIWTTPWPRQTAMTNVPAETLELRDADFTPDAGTIDSPAGMVLDASGDLYILDSDGELFRVDAPGPYQIPT
ncbi:MAG TPA: cadherin repeat domain-containing protein [Novosphingobium sp.]|nr:cadherin repeat domain-containing protein [Novosphingobium sp.]